jgi:site-specific recombinase XerD
MTLTEAVESYLILKRSLGAVFSADARILHSFVGAIGDVPLESIQRETCQAFCRGTGPPTRFWERKHYTLRGFFSYLIARGHLLRSPLPDAGPQIPRAFQAYIYSPDELRRILDATSVLETDRWKEQALTFRTILLVLYGAGLRPGEALRLRCCDVDLGARLLAIWDTKFFKSRLVPIGADLCKSLDRYSTVRQRLPLLDETRSSFFCTDAGLAISLGKLEKVFVRLREYAGIRRPATDRWQPRLHDIRHAFAVGRLIAWYRDGADVQACLPLLATYLGHINLSGTQTYLTMTPELLGEASLRFERYVALPREDDHA